MPSSGDGGLIFINAHLTGGGGAGRMRSARSTCNLDTVRIADGVIAEIGSRPRSRDRVIDLRGDRLLPGLINAHDHLQLNHFPSIEYEKPYANASAWVSDISARLRVDRGMRASAAVPRDERLFLGGLKNLLSGVTTVAHHDPVYLSMSGPEFPTRVITDFGWSHSLYLDGDERVRRSYRETPSSWPWIIHAAEGVDPESAAELNRLAALDCLGANTLIVHGVALGADQRAQLLRARAGLIWCPSSNVKLFARTAEVADLLGQRCVALGTDSRLTGARDLLDELKLAATRVDLPAAALETLVTADSARLLRRADRGVIRAGALADLLILPAAIPLSRASRTDVALVMIGGVARYGDSQYVHAAAPHGSWASVHVDGRAKLLDAHLAARLAASSVQEPGVLVAAAAWRVA